MVVLLLCADLVVKKFVWNSDCNVDMEPIKPTEQKKHSHAEKTVKQPLIPLVG